MTEQPTTMCHDIPYLQLLDRILQSGVEKGDRTGTGTRSIFGAQLRFSLRHAFPLLTTKKVPLRWVAEELFWFLSGSTNEKALRARGVDIWAEWATKEQTARFDREEGDLGPIYSHQWRNFGATRIPDFMLHNESEYQGNGTDQILEALRMLLGNPDSRRIIVTGWHPADANLVTLPPCHTLYQFNTHLENGKRVLNCHMYQRSADMFLGVPFNIASYALLTHMFAYVLDYEPGELIISFGDAHIYNNHFEQVREQLSRQPRQSPRLQITKPHPGRGVQPMILTLLDIKWEHIALTGYKPDPKISAPVAV